MSGTEQPGSVVPREEENGVAAFKLDIDIPAKVYVTALQAQDVAAMSEADNKTIFKVSYDLHRGRVIETEPE